jgi:hypothetical protein
MRQESDEIREGWKSRIAAAQGRLCRLVPVIAVLCILAWCFVSLHSNFSRDDADSEILNQAWQLANGQDIYRDINTPPFAFAAYPPLYFALVAALLKITGLSFLPAKLLSFLAAVSIGAAFVRMSREWKGTVKNGLWLSFLLFLIPAFLYNAVRSHVQILAVAFSIWSLVFFLRNRWWATAVVSPLLAVLAVYTKQTQIALPLAAILFLAFRNRRWLLPYLATIAIAGLVPFFWLQRVTHGDFFLNTFSDANLAYNVWQIPLILIHHAGPVFIFLAFALRICWKRRASGRWDIVDYYLICITAATVISVGRIGAHGQYVVEWIVVSLLYLLYTTDIPSLPGKKLLVSLQILILLVYAPLFVLVEEGIGNYSSYRAAQKVYPLIKEHAGPILSQQGSFALFARGRIYIQLFHFTGLYRSGLWDENLLVKRIDDRIFSWIITEFPLENPDLSADDRERFTPEMVEALRRNYRRKITIPPYYLYRPEPPERADTMTDAIQFPIAGLVSTVSATDPQ